MTFKIFYPILYLVVGYALSFLNINIKKISSTVLSKVVIPYIIIHHVVMNQKGLFTIIIATIIIMAIMMLIGRAISKDPIKLLCFSYLNIGWLGLPIATALFGNEVSGFIIAVYVGSSLFGNIIGAGLLANNGQKTIHVRLLNLAKSPPFIALIIGFLLINFSTELSDLDSYIYAPAKFLMAFLGMMVLGMWLEETKIRKEDIIDTAIFSSLRVFILCCITSAIIYVSEKANIEWFSQHYQVLYLICLLPPAANIVILETYYLKKGKSASIIAIDTCFSILLIAIYIGLITFLRLNN